MTLCGSDDAQVRSLERLVLLTPDPGRTERVRARCRAQLVRRRRRTARSSVMADFARRVLAPVVVGGFCVLYVAALVAATLRLQGVFH